MTTGTFHAQSTDSKTSVTWINAYGPGTVSATGQRTSITTSTDTGSTRTQTGTTTQTVNTTMSATQPVNGLSWTYTSAGTSTSRTTLTGTSTWTSTASLSYTGTSTWTGTGTATGTWGSSSATTTSTTTATTTLTSTYQKTGSACGTVTGSATVTENGTVSGTPTVTGTGTVTVSFSTTGTGTVSGTSVLTGNGNVTGNVSVTATGNVTGSTTATGTGTAVTTTTTTTATSVSVTYTATTTVSATATETISTCSFQGSTDPSACYTSPSTPTTSGYCNYSTGVPCNSDGVCTSISNAVKGDFCRFISSSDGSGRQSNEPCVTYSGSPWGNCKHGIATIGATCSSSGDTSCNSALAGDFCIEGKPAMMCADSGLWCTSMESDCPGNPSTDLCVPASSRMMTAKRALRRAITEYSEKVNFGFMNSYQGRTTTATSTSTSTSTDTNAYYPYAKLQSCSSTVNVTEKKFLARGELEKAGCFSLTTGPTSSCMIDNGGNGAINSTASQNQITYSLLSGDDSRWVISRGSSTGPQDHQNASWSSCFSASSAIMPTCAFSGGTGLYQGSYYTFTYKQGTPIVNGGGDGEGSLAHPTYFTTYKGKYYDAGGGNCYNAIDAQRTDIVNDGIYGRTPYTCPCLLTTPATCTSCAAYPPTTVPAAADLVPVPWSGSTNASACDATTGAIWNSSVVPFLNSTVSQTGTATSTATATFAFNGKTITRAQKTLMTTARLEKASFGGVYGTGAISPLGCDLKNDVVHDQYHSAADYMSQAQSNDTANNGGNTPCWNNNIILVVDGQSTGPGDTGSAIDCASAACAYNADTNPTLAGCYCAAITKAFALAHSGTPVQTHIVVNAPATWNTRFPYSYAMLWNMAVAGSPNFDGTPIFGTTEEEVYQGVVSKIAASQSRFPFTTTSAVAGPSTQSPGGVITYSGMLYDTSVDYPSWAGSVRAYQTSSGFAELQWNAVTVPASVAATYGRDWKSRRVFFSSPSGVVAQVQIASDGTIGNKSDLHSAGLGATDAEAEKIAQWLLGNPTSNNPTPVMGSVTASTPIVVGQPGASGLNGSTPYSQTNATRPTLLYVGGDDGMLHAFFAQPATLALKYGGSNLTFMGGEEAFAFIPNDMLPVITRQYVQGGQKLSPDQADHIFGLAASPKVRDLCEGPTCATSDGTDWHTILVMPEGIGGNKPFALDITGVIDQHNLLAQPPSLQWQPGIKAASGAWDQSLGQTQSIPAFYFNRYDPTTGSADNRVVMASGYATKLRTGSYASQGLSILNADAVTGAVQDVQSVGNNGNCTQNHAVLADIALARDYSSATTAQNLRAGYVGDTWGNLYQYVPGQTPTNPPLFQFGCGQPIHFAPAVVQLERAKADSPSKGLIYVVQVTNSNLDSATNPASHSGPYFPSELIVTRLTSATNPPTVDTSFNSNGQIVLRLDHTATTDAICLNTTLKDKTSTCPGGTAVPETARPMATPTVILRPDGLGFQVITSWYDATAISNNCGSGNQFSVGTSYITVHEFGYNGAWYQIAGIAVDSSVVTGVTFVGAGLFIDGILNGSSGVAAQTIAGQTFGFAQQLSTTNSTIERFMRTNWTERLDL
jgi:hypothetical protein